MLRKVREVFSSSEAERTRSLVALAWNSSASASSSSSNFNSEDRSFAKGETLSEAETERRQRRQWRRQRRVREWERESERDWDWEESQRVREWERDREWEGIESHCVFFKHVRNFWVGLMSGRWVCKKFLNLQTEFKELGFYAQKLSSLNSVSMPRNRVHWTRFLVYVDPRCHLSC